MSSRHHHSSPRPLRLFGLVLIAFGLVMQPILASIGEVHGLTHDAAGALESRQDPHSLADQTADSGHGINSPDDEGPLHALMHCAQCCAQVGALWSLDVHVSSMAPAASKPVMADARHVVRSPLLAPFRPPIAA